MTDSPPPQPPWERRDPPRQLISRLLVAAAGVPAGLADGLATVLLNMLGEEGWRLHTAPKRVPQGGWDCRDCIGDPTDHDEHHPDCGWLRPDAPGGHP